MKSILPICNDPNFGHFFPKSVNYLINVSENWGVTPPFQNVCPSRKMRIQKMN